MIRVHAEAVRNIRSAAENKVMSSKIEKYMFSTGSQVTDLVKWQYKKYKGRRGQYGLLEYSCRSFRFCRDPQEWILLCG
ncbi:hypothetical protein Selli1_17000 [Sellimonas catena]|uniref:Uncharacterized protein n=1 Tax=Sellimonas catena TaxID=2994035 RepID=A0A9W6FEE5_9FIRM|nr:hypothetical protein Selli1_17000 [Sellimonas catena]